MSASTPRKSDPKAQAAAAVLSARLKIYWSLDLNWTLVPVRSKEVSRQRVSVVLSACTFIAAYCKTYRLAVLVNFKLVLKVGLFCMSP